MAGAPKGNKNAKGNRGGGAPTMNDRTLAAEVRSLALGDIRGVLKGSLYADDPDFKKQVLLKLASSILPRLNEVTGSDGKDLFPVPILTNMDVPAHDRDKEDSGPLEAD